MSDRVEEVRAVLWDCVRTHIAAGGRVYNSKTARMFDLEYGLGYRPPPAAVCLLGAVGAWPSQDTTVYQGFMAVAEVLGITTAEVNDLEAGFEEWCYDLGAPFVALGAEIAAQLHTETESALQTQVAAEFMLS